MLDSSFAHVSVKGPYAGLLESCIRAFRENVCKRICALNLILLYCRAKYCINPTWDLCRTRTYPGLKFHTRFGERPLCRITSVLVQKYMGFSLDLALLKGKILRKSHLELMQN